MKPRISILDRAFAYKPSYATAIPKRGAAWWRPVNAKQEPERSPQFASFRARGERTRNKQWRSM